jgi:hypothetical protein
MECQSCHAELPAGATVCPSCGRSVTPDPDMTVISTRRLKSAQTAQPPRAVTPPPAGQRPRPGPKGGARALFMDFNQLPREIVRVMHEARQQASAFNAARRRRTRLLWLLFPLGLPFVCADAALGYNVFTFSLVALTLWLGAIVGLIVIRRQGKAAEFGPKFDLACTVFETLKDDVSPKRGLVGWLDLTGAEQESKKTRTKSSASGQPIVYYRDEWLRMKASLYDGNVLRVSVIDRVKARQGFWKRSRSGKHKYRSGSSQSECQLEFSVSVDTGRYTLRSFDRQVTAIPNSRFVIRQAEASDGHLVLSAAAAGQFDAWDILNALHFGYDQVQVQPATSS